jgi:hypothetical protein
VGTSAPQPVGALVAYLLVEQVEALLPFSFAFAAGAMLTLIAVELLPKAYAGPGRLGPSGASRSELRSCSRSASPSAFEVEDWRGQCQPGVASPRWPLP